MRETLQRLRERSHSAVREKGAPTVMVVVLLLSVVAGVASVATEPATDSGSGIVSAQQSVGFDYSVIPDGWTVRDSADFTSIDAFYLGFGTDSRVGEHTAPELSDTDTEFTWQAEMTEYSADKSYWAITLDDTSNPESVRLVFEDSNPSVGGSDRLKVFRDGDVEVAHVNDGNDGSGFVSEGDQYNVSVAYTESTGNWSVSIRNETANVSADTLGMRPSDIDTVEYGAVDHDTYNDPNNLTLNTQESRVEVTSEGATTYFNSLDLEGGGETRLSVDTRSLFQSSSTHPYSVYFEGEGEVTDNATVTSSNSTVLSVNEQDNTLSAIDDSNVNETVTVQAEYNDEVATKDVVVAEPTVENLQILPGGTWRFSAVMTDSFFQALLVALFVGVAATRFTSAFAGIAGSQMMLVIGWFAGYVPWVYAVLGLFVALFIGLNLAANIDYTVRR